MNQNASRRCPVMLVTLLALAVIAGLPARARAVDYECGQCIHWEIDHHTKIPGHPTYGGVWVHLQDNVCNMGVEAPPDTFDVVADGILGSHFVIDQKIQGSCVFNFFAIGVSFLDPNQQLLEQTNPAQYGEIVNKSSSGDQHIEFDYRHPTQMPADGQRFYVVVIGVTYILQVDQRIAHAKLAIRVHRPPVLMVHGLWSNRGAFAAMEKDFAASNYFLHQILRADYSPTNDAHFATNQDVVRKGIDELIGACQAAKLATCKVDLVAHSMGGILSRMYLQEDYRNDVRRLVTCNTPHAGAQTANLLRDGNFALPGLLCAGLKIKGSCNNGAVEDLQAPSQAIMDLNTGSHPAGVEVHALTTAAAPLSSQARIVPMLMSWPIALAELVGRECIDGVLESAFGSLDHDMVVPQRSQNGGLSGILTSRITNQQHVGSVSNPAVIARARSLLNEFPGSSSFTTAGFSPEPMGYVTPPRCPGLGTSAAARATNGIAGSATIQIVSPSSGSGVAAGTSFPLLFATSGPIDSIVVIAEFSGDSLCAGKGGSAGPVTLAMPVSAIGHKRVLAVGLDASGQVIAVSDPDYFVDVTVGASLTSLRVYPTSLFQQQGASTILSITGRYSDGVDRDLSHWTGLSFAFTTGSASRVGESGVLLSGMVSDTVRVSAGAVSAARVPVNVIVPSGVVGVEATPESAAQGGGLTAVPNPMRGSTMLRYSLKEAGSPTIEICDISGRRIRTIVGAPAEPGSHVVQWDGVRDDGTRARVGIYFVKLTGTRFPTFGRILVIR